MFICLRNRNGCEGPHNHIATEDICGRPLGLCSNKKTRDVYIADAYMGLLVVGPNGGLATKLTSEAEGVPFKFTNGVDIDDTTGDVYFTDSSSIYTRRYASTYLSVLLKFNDELAAPELLNHRREG